jgi:hypothetical protein
MVGEAVKQALSLYYQSQNTSPLDPITEPVLDPSIDILSDGNNGHGNDEGGFDPSNPGQGNGNNGNNGNGRPNNNDDGGLTVVGDKSVSITNGVYDMTGKQVNLRYASSGMYLVVENGVVIRKVWK